MSDPPLPMSMARRFEEIERRLRSLEFPLGPRATTGIATATTSAVSTTSSTYTRVAIAVFYADTATLGYDVGTTCASGDIVSWRLVCYVPDGTAYDLMAGNDAYPGATHSGNVQLPAGSRKDYIVEFQIRRSSGTSGSVSGYLNGPFTAER